MNEAEVLREIGALREAVTNASKNIDHLRVENAEQHRGIKAEVAEVKEHVKETNHRLTVVEKWRERLAGVGWAIGRQWPVVALVLGIVGGYILEKLWG